MLAQPDGRAWIGVKGIVCGGVFGAAAACTDAICGATAVDMGDKATVFGTGAAFGIVAVKRLSLFSISFVFDVFAGFAIAGFGLVKVIALLGVVGNRCFAGRFRIRSDVTSSKISVSLLSAYKGVLARVGTSRRNCFCKGSSSDTSDNEIGLRSASFRFFGERDGPLFLTGDMMAGIKGASDDDSDAT